MAADRYKPTPESEVRFTTGEDVVMQIGKNPRRGRDNWDLYLVWGHTNTSDMREVGFSVVRGLISENPEGGRPAFLSPDGDELGFAFYSIRKPREEEIRQFVQKAEKRYPLGSNQYIPGHVRSAYEHGQRVLRGYPTRYVRNFRGN